MNQYPSSTQIQGNIYRPEGMEGKKQNSDLNNVSGLRKWIDLPPSMTSRLD